jgi:Ca2+-binding RTX toxin-like protein
MIWKIPLSTNTAITLNAGENLYVAKDVGIYVGDDYAIYAVNLSEIIIEGSVISGDYTAIVASTFGDDPSYKMSVTVTASGRVKSLDDSAIGMGGPNCKLNNAGTITADDWAIGVSGDVGDTTTITNSGKISSSSQEGIYSSTAGTLVLHNSGAIISGKSFLSGNGVAYSSGDGLTDTSLITNTGRMVGKVQMGFGNDLYDGRKGHVTDAVTGGDGKDRIYGGTENNILSGGNGKDQLLGGGGADILTGGPGADRFIFKTLSDSTVAARGRDTITDFAPGRDTIDLHSIDANSKVDGNQAFLFIGGQDFHHKAGELHIVRSSGDTVVEGDVNGDGKADFAIALTGHINLNSGDFAL